MIGLYYRHFFLFFYHRIRQNTFYTVIHALSISTALFLLYIYLFITDIFWYFISYYFYKSVLDSQAPSSFEYGWNILWIRVFSTLYCSHHFVLDMNKMFGHTWTILFVDLFTMALENLYTLAWKKCVGETPMGTIIHYNS